MYNMISYIGDCHTGDMKAPLLLLQAQLLLLRAHLLRAC